MVETSPIEWSYDDLSKYDHRVRLWCELSLFREEETILPLMQSHLILRAMLPCARSKKFNVTPGQVQRSVKIDMLLSSKSNHFMSDQVIKTVGQMKLYIGRLVVFGGYDDSLEFDNDVKSFLTRAIPVISSVKHSRVIKSLNDNEILKYR